MWVVWNCLLSTFVTTPLIWKICHPSDTCVWCSRTVYSSKNAGSTSGIIHVLTPLNTVIILLIFRTTIYMVKLPQYAVTGRRKQTFFLMVWGSIVGQTGPPRSRSLTITLSYTLKSVGLLWAWVQSKTEASTWQHNTQRRQTSIPPAGLETIVPASEKLQPYALSHETSGISEQNTWAINKCLTRMQDMKGDMFENI